MSMSGFRWPPATLRRAKLDNPAFVPGSMLPYKGAVLIVLPPDNDTQRMRPGPFISAHLPSQNEELRRVDVEGVQRTLIHQL